MWSLGRRGSAVPFQGGQGAELPETDANQAGPDEIESELARIRGAVRAGSTDLARLGFWRLMGRLKADPALAERFADTAGRIDAEAFEQRVRPRFPVWFGNAVLGSGAAMGGGLLGWAVASDDP